MKHCAASRCRMQPFEATVNGKTYTATANADGYFDLPIDRQTENAVITLKINGKAAGSQTVVKNPGKGLYY